MNRDNGQAKDAEIIECAQDIEGDYVKVKSPLIIMECLGCQERLEYRLVNAIKMRMPPITFEEIEEYQRQIEAMKWVRQDGTPLNEGDIIPSLCPNCFDLGLELKPWGIEAERIPIIEVEE